MLSGLSIENFRGFSKHHLPFSELTIIVGKNNAGKSTIVEALRLVSIVTSRYRNLIYKTSPSWTGLPKRYYGVSPSLKNLEINFESIFYQYQDPPAKLIAEFSDGSNITIYLADEEKVFSIIRDGGNKIIKSRQEAIQAALPGVAIMPQVTPVQKQEVILNADYVRRSMASHLSSYHFRNQLKVFNNLFQEFQESVEETWHGVQVKELIAHSNLHGEPIYLEVRNEDFVAEISAMGHGLQMWLQTMWFLTRSKNALTIILDEPDVYMHADLQRKIIRYIRGRFPQVLLTTHSVEIMSEVQPEEILVIDRKAEESAPASTIPAVQKLIENVGSAHNIQLARLWGSKRFLLVEGQDLRILKQIQNILFPNSEVPSDTIPNMSIGGWGGWGYVIGSSMTLKNALGQTVKTYCLLDSDYHTKEAIEERLKEAKNHGIQLHVWSMKEIENYLLVPSTIQRLINKRVAKRTFGPKIEEVDIKLNQLANNLEEVVFDGFASEILAEKRGLGSGGANKRARALLKEKKKNPGILSVIPGKTLLSELSKWSQREFGVSLSSNAIAREMRRDEIPAEMQKVVNAIEQQRPF